MEDVRTASLDSVQKALIDDLLQQADKHIRGGRYLAADELLQKVFAFHPDNSVARSYQDRIQFLIKQLSQRVGLETDIYDEIRKYRELLIKRKSHQINSFLSSAQKFLDDGSFRKASEQASKALAIDPDNIYAKALLQRLTELQHTHGSTVAETEREYKFCSTLREYWRNGKPSGEQLETLKGKQNELKISEGKRLELEREIKNELYKNALQNIWNTGGLSAFTSETIDTLRNNFDISRIDHSYIESSLLRDFRKNKIKGNILIMDDNDELLLEMTGKLRSNFFAVIAAGTLDEALASLKIVTPGIIISQMNFPSGQMGFELYEFIRSKRYMKHIPFIFMTPSLDRTTHLIGKRLGVDEFIQIPIDYELLVATLDGILHTGIEHHPAPKQNEQFLAQSFRR
jgi:CheY-like chemotaxis protein